MKNEYAEKDGEKEYAESTDREADTDRQIETNTLRASLYAIRH